jgi:CBS domain-containing protein
MATNSVEAVPVIDAAGRMVGIVTESDIVRWLVR